MADATVANQDQQARAAHRVLDLLDRIDDRLIAHYVKQRRHERRKVRTRIVVCFPDIGSSVPARSSSRRYLAWARSVSQGGLSFVLPVEIPSKRCLIGLTMGDSELVWFQSDIVRHREVTGEEFWEYGIAFRGRDTDEDSTEPAADLQSAE